MDLSNVNLEAIIERELGTGEGNPPAWCCPFHNDHEPSLKLWPDPQHWRCFGCGRHGDAIDWLREQRGLSFKAACEALDLVPESNTGNSETASKNDPKPPGEVWRQHAESFVAYAQRQLWTASGAEALAYLHEDRGLTSETIRHSELGWHEKDRWRPSESWGMISGKKIWLPEGIVIPWRMDGLLWFVNVRRMKGDRAVDNPKYIGAKGGRRPLYGVDHLRGEDAIFICEGEFDALLLWQEAGDLADVVALGGAAFWPNVTFLARLAMAPRWFVVTDLDEAGEKGARRWQRYSGRVKRVGALRGNDLTDFWRGGGNLRAWVRYHKNAELLAAPRKGVDTKSAEATVEGKTDVATGSGASGVEAGSRTRLELEAKQLLEAGLAHVESRQRYAEIAQELDWPCWGAMWEEWVSFFSNDD